MAAWPHLTVVVGGAARGRWRAEQAVGEARARECDGGACCPGHGQWRAAAPYLSRWATAKIEREARV